MIELNTIVNATLGKFEKDSLMEEIIEKQMKATMERVVKEVCGPYSEFQKELEKNIKEKLKVNFDSLNIEQYNQFVTEVVKDNLKENLLEVAAGDLNTRLGELITTSKDDYTLTEVLEELKKESDLERYDESEQMSLYIKNHGYRTSVSLDSDSGKDEYNCSYNFDVDTKTGKINSLECKKYYNIATKTEKPLKQRFGFEEFLYSAFLHGSKINFNEGFDEDDYYDDLTTGGEDLDY